MSWRFQKRISIFPGFRLNISRSGISTSLGPRGASLTLRAKSKPTVNLGIPGSGLSTRFSLGGTSQSAADDEAQTGQQPDQIEPTVQEARRLGKLFLIGFFVSLLVVGYFLK
jgi:hypothetical protein